MEVAKFFFLTHKKDSKCATASRLLTFLANFQELILPLILLKKNMNDCTQLEDRFIIFFIFHSLEYNLRHRRQK